MILDSIKIKNFKAVRDSGAVKLGPLTALVGNNGAGKSSLIEALETYQAVLDLWRGRRPCLQPHQGRAWQTEKTRCQDCFHQFQYVYVIINYNNT